MIDPKDRKTTFFVAITFKNFVRIIVPNSTKIHQAFIKEVHEHKYSGLYNFNKME